MSEQDTTETATGTETQVDESAETQTDDGKVEGEDALGDPGKKALDTMKQKLRDAEKARNTEKARADALEQAAALKDKPAEEQALEAARAEARTEATKKANERILRADLRAAATGKLADPADAALYIDLNEFTVTDDGETDSDALNDAITDLLERKPHLAAAPTTRFQGAGDGGAKAKAKPSEDIDDAIAAARAARDFPLVATLQTQKAAQTKK